MQRALALTASFVLGLLALTPVSARAPQNTTVIPAGFTDTPASASSAYPFGRGAPVRVQHLYEAHDTGIRTPILVTGFEVRALQTGSFAAKSNIDMQISMSTTAATRPTITGTFAANHGANETVVYTRKMTSINASSPGWVGGYTGVFVFDTPFLYLPTQGNLLIDLDVASIPAGTWSSDQPSAAVRTSDQHAAVGTGCGGLGASSTGGAVGGLGAQSYPLTFSMTGGAPNAPALLLIGLDELAAPIPVPGNPTCLVFQDLRIVLVETLTAAGSGSSVIPIPQDPNLRALVVYGQWAAVRSAAPLVVETTHSRRVVLDGRWDVARVFNITSNTAPTGSVQQFAVSVTRLHH